MAAAHTVLETYADVFIEDMLRFVHEQHGMVNASLLPPTERNVSRQKATYRFTSEIGNALLHLLRETIIEYPNTFSERNNRSPGANFIRCHEAASLTDDLFVYNTHMWCKVLFDFLLNVSSLYIYFGGLNPVNITDISDIKVSAAEVLFRVMDSFVCRKFFKLRTYAKELRKILKLSTYAKEVKNRPPYAQMF